MMERPIKQYKPAEELELKEIKKKAFQKIYCPSCEEVVTAEHLDLQNNLAKCGSCHVIFSIEEEVASVKTKKKMKQEIIRPEGIDLFYFEDDLDITVQQHLQGLDAFGIAILPLFAFFSIIIYFAKDISIYYPIIFSLGALYFLYRVLDYSKNKTYIDINNKFLSIRHRPKNFRKDKVYAVDEIDQLYLKNAVDGSGYFTVQMIVNGLEGQKHQKLVTLNTLSKAKFLEQEIERYLKIKDRAVPESDY